MSLAFRNKRLTARLPHGRANPTIAPVGALSTPYRHRPHPQVSRAQVSRAQVSRAQVSRGALRPPRPSASVSSVRVRRRVSALRGSRCLRGGVPEWLNGAVSKTVVRAIVPRVRIPLPPPPNTVGPLELDNRLGVGESIRVDSWGFWLRYSPIPASRLEGLPRISGALFAIATVSSMPVGRRGPSAWIVRPLLRHMGRRPA